MSGPLLHVENLQVHFRTEAGLVAAVLWIRGSLETQQFAQYKIVFPGDVSGLAVDSKVRYRGVDRPTDVLAFAMREGPFAHLNPQILGDIVISAETALRQARAGRRPLAEELTHLLIHGTLHLLGYDHEVSPTAARLMFAKGRVLWRQVAPPLLGPPQHAGKSPLTAHPTAGCREARATRRGAKPPRQLQADG